MKWLNLYIPLILPNNDVEKFNQNEAQSKCTQKKLPVCCTIWWLRLHLKEWWQGASQTKKGGLSGKTETRTQGSSSQTDKHRTRRRRRDKTVRVNWRTTQTEESVRRASCGD